MKGILENECNLGQRNQRDGLDLFIYFKGEARIKHLLHPPLLCHSIETGKREIQNSSNMVRMTRKKRTTLNEKGTQCTCAHLSMLLSLRVFPRHLQATTPCRLHKMIDLCS